MPSGFSSINHFDVREYSFATFQQIISEFFSDMPIAEFGSNKYHFNYFKEYFGKIVPSTIVLEYKYVDKDYLEDFQAYYVRCFKKYRRKCLRLHFFSDKFTKESFKSSIVYNDLAFSKDSYLGFIVIKPIPKTIFGRTCLMTYPEFDSDGNKREFLTLTENKVNLFGINLKVDSLPYQEQDHIVAACATSALWSSFQCTGSLYQHAIPSMSEITSLAISDNKHHVGSFPNDGLTIEQMCSVIRQVGLVPYLIDVFDLNKAGEDELLVTSVIYAYLKAKNPVIMIVNLVEVDKANIIIQESWDEESEHAVSITGFSYSTVTKSHEYSRFNSNVSIRLKSFSIKKVFVHDDQIGPFSRMKNDGVEIRKKLSITEIQQLNPNISNSPTEEVDYEEITTEKSLYSLSSSWETEYNGGKETRAIVDNFIIPVYHKIRIPYGVIQDAIFEFQLVLYSLFSREIDSFCWDIYLISNNDLKSEILAKNIDPSLKERVLFHPLPKFIWRANLSFNDFSSLDFIFDATDISQGKILNTVIPYDKGIYDCIHEALESTHDSFESQIHAMFTDHSSLSWKLIKFIGQKNYSSLVSS